MKQNKLTNDNNLATSSIVDVVLIGSGVMSTTLGILLNILDPNLTIHMYERLEKTTEESSNGWNNAGTGHSAFCELNYTTQNKYGEIDISKAIYVNESFEISLQFWAYLVKKNILKSPKSFINIVPHMSFVWGEKNINFLYKRFKALQQHVCFNEMIYSNDPKKIKEWAPLIMDGRKSMQKVAATYIATGTDINFGEITQQLLYALKKSPKFSIYSKHDVINITRNFDNTWKMYVTNNNKQIKNRLIVRARYVFIGAGGAALKLLQKSGIPEGTKYAGLPIGGAFLVSTNPSIVNHHLAKVYGISPINTPPMSVPHIDTRIFNGNRVLLFGPFATLSSKFLKYGSYLDFFQSITLKNIIPILQVGLNNLSLIKYLIKQGIMSKKDRLNYLREYYPKAQLSDWSLIKAGQRVQIIKKDKQYGGVLKFGTEIVSSDDGTLSALLGASPGASIAVSIILNILTYMFKQNIDSSVWQYKLKEMIPFYGKKINFNLDLANEIKKDTNKLLELNSLI